MILSLFTPSLHTVKKHYVTQYLLDSETHNCAPLGTESLKLLWATALLDKLFCRGVVFLTVLFCRLLKPSEISTMSNAMFSEKSTEEGIAKDHTQFVSKKFKIKKNDATLQEHYTKKKQDWKDFSLKKWSREKRKEMRQFSFKKWRRQRREKAKQKRAEKEQRDREKAKAKCTTNLKNVWFSSSKIKIFGFLLTFGIGWG